MQDYIVIWTLERKSDGKIITINLPRNQTVNDDDYIIVDVDHIIISI